MTAEEVNPCDWCTFINAPGRVRCAMCRRNVRKRPRGSANNRSPEPISAPEKQQGDGKETDLSTLFSTAAGQVVRVSESSLHAARRRLDAEQEPGDAPCASTGGGGCGDVSTLFSTAAGQVVRVSESSLHAARRVMSTEDKETSLKGNDIIPTESSCCPGSHSPAAMRPLFAGRRQGRFVVPFARTPQKQQTSSTTAPQAPHLPDTSVQQGPRRLSLDLFAYSSLSMSVLPSSEAILQGSFAFKGTGCSQDLLRLLGVSVEGNIIASSCFRTALQKLGATSTGCTEEWCGQMLKSTLLKLRALSLHCRTPLPVFSVTHSLLYLCFKYNREFVDGERPTLRIVTEGDVPASSLMVVYVVSLSLTDRLAPHTCTGVISDGCYEVKISLDMPLTNLVREGVIRRGQKLLVCGAKMLLKNFCSPLECSGDVVLAINYNCTRPVDPATALGLYHIDPPVLSSTAIHSLGGLVPSLRGTVERVLPPIFIEQTVIGDDDKSGRDGGGAAKGATRVVRNLLAQLKSHERALREAATLSDTTNNRRLVRVTSFVLTCEQKEDVVLQLWEDCNEGCMVDPLEESAAEFPVEGSGILVFAVTPSRGRPSHPFQNAKVVYTRGRLDYRQLEPPNGFVRQLQRSAEDMNPETPAGTPIDFGGFCVAFEKVDAVNSFVIVMMNTEEISAAPSFCIIDIPCATPVKEILLAIPTTPFAPVIVQNASFIRRADEDLGPDCLHVLANEFTRVLQRPAAASLRAVLSSLEGVRDKAMATNSISARAAELLRLRQLSDEARSGVRRFSCELSGSSDVSVAVSSGKSSRVPYYMRGEKQSPISRGVVIPSVTAKPQPQTEPKAAVPRVVQQHRGRSHVFGNIIGMRLLRAFDSGKLESVTLLAENVTLAAEDAVRRVGLHHMSVEGSSQFEVDIQFGAIAQHRITAKITDPRLLSGMLEERIAIRSVCALAVDEGCVDYHVRRNKLLEDWQQTPEEIWWRLLTLSCVVARDAPQSTATTAAAAPETAAVMWLESEWRMLLEMVEDGVKNCLFKFSLDPSGEVVRMVFIRDDCPLDDLMRE